MATTSSKDTAHRASEAGPITKAHAPAPKATANETFEHNIAPAAKPKASAESAAKPATKADPLDHDENGRKGGARKPATDVAFVDERAQHLEDLEKEFQAKVKASAKGTPVDALGLPEALDGKGDLVWSNAIEAGPLGTNDPKPAEGKDGKSSETTKETKAVFASRLDGAEAALVHGANEYLQVGTMGSLRGLAYVLTRDENTGIVKLSIVNTDVAERTDPARVGGLPNELGKY